MFFEVNKSYSGIEFMELVDLTWIFYKMLTEGEKWYLSAHYFLRHEDVSWKIFYILLSIKKGALSAFFKRAMDFI